jgi:hypothetical protein
VRGGGCQPPALAGSFSPSHRAIGRRLHPTSGHRRGGRPFARAGGRSPRSSPSPGRTGSRPRAVPSRWGRRSGARAGSAWWRHCASGGGKSVAVGRRAGSNRAARMLIAHSPSFEPVCGCLTRPMATTYRRASLAFGDARGGGGCEEGWTDCVDVPRTRTADTGGAAFGASWHAAAY